MQYEDELRTMHLRLIPDAWYDIWKEMEPVITFRRHYPGCYEADVTEQLL